MRSCFICKSIPHLTIVTRAEPIDDICLPEIETSEELKADCCSECFINLKTLSAEALEKIESMKKEKLNS